MPNFPLFYRILKAALFEDWVLKFICLAMAVLMWFYIDGELTAEGNFTVTMRPADLQVPSGWELAPNSLLPEFLVRVRGPRRRLQLNSGESIVFKFKKHRIDNPHYGRNPLNIGSGELEADGFEIISVTTKDEREAAVELVATTISIRPEAITRKRQFGVRAVALPGTAMIVEPNSVEVEVTAEPRDFDELAQKTILYVDWPHDWERPKDNLTVLGPLLMHVHVLAPPRIQVHGVNGQDLPTVNVRAALSAALEKVK